jgi:hypothetical protein
LLCTLCDNAGLILLQGEAVNLTKKLRIAGVAAVSIVVTSCTPEPVPESSFQAVEVVKPRPNIYAEFTLTADLSDLSDDQREVVRLLIQASQIMDDLFWRQSYGDDYETWLESIADADTRRFAELNYGPWDRLDGDKPFMKGVGAKPLGAKFYPTDMSKEEFEQAYLPGKNGLYSFVRVSARQEWAVFLRPS